MISWERRWRIDDFRPLRSDYQDNSLTSPAELMEVGNMFKHHKGMTVSAVGPDESFLARFA